MHPLSLIATLRGRVRALLRRDVVERDLGDEIRFHLEMEVEKNVRRGMSADEAKRAAMRAFGRVDRVSEAHRDARGTRLVEEILTDLHYASRTLLRSPGFVAVSVVTLAIAISVGTSLFSAVNGFFYRPLPVEGGRELVSLFTSDFDGREWRGGTSLPDLASFSQAANAIADIAAESRITLGIGTGDEVTMMSGALVTPNYFRTLRLHPFLGRIPAVARADEPRIVISYMLWRRVFASDTSVVGREVRVNGNFFTVAAVMPPNFIGTLNEWSDEFWIDATFASLLLPDDDVLTKRGYRSFHAIARLSDGATQRELKARLDLAAARLFQDDPATWRDTTGKARRVTVMSEPEARIAGVGKADLLLVVGGVTALGFALLALASTNLASMQMARAAARRREIATRLALGAGRARLVRQLLTESALIAVPGAVLGLALTIVASTLVAQYRPAGLPKLEVTLDLWTLLFIVSGMLLSMLVFGLMPALQSVRDDVVTDLKGIDQPARRGLRIGGMRGGLIIVQVALCVMFSAVSTLVVLGLARSADDSLLDDDRVLVAPLTLLPAAGDSARAPQFVRELVASLEALPGVAAVSAAYYVSIPGVRTTSLVSTRGPNAQTGREVDVNSVLPKYFAVTGLRVLRGRDFRDEDMIGKPRVALMSRVMAERLWPGADPLGKQLHLDYDSTDVEVIGLVGELRAQSPNATGPSSGGMLYLPLHIGMGSSPVLHIRATGPATAITSRVVTDLRRRNTRLVTQEIMPMDRFMERARIAERVAARASGVLAALQLVLAIAGLAGLVAYVTARRSREIGIRAALGADRASILSLVMRQGIRLAAIGGSVGIALSYAIGIALRDSLPIGASIELRALGAAAVGFTLIAGVAMLIPAWRALAVAPATALRAD